MLHKFTMSLIIALALVLSACAAPAAPSVTETLAGTETPAATEVSTTEISGSLSIYSGRSEVLIQPVLDAFQEAYPQVEILLKSGENSELANAILEERQNPQADIFITTELLTVQRLSQEGVFQSYRSPASEAIPQEFIGPDATWTGITRRARVIMYNTERVSEEEAPKSIFDLTDPQWQGELAAAGSTNGSMQAQIAAMSLLLGEEETKEWLSGLIENDTQFFGGHTDVRKSVGAGEFQVGLVNHYYYYLQKAEGSPVGIIFPDQGEGEIGLITNATAVAILEGASNLAAAQAFVDFLLSSQGQEIFARQNFEYPLVSGVPLHPDVEPLDQFRLAEVDVAQAAANLDQIFDLIEAVGLP